MTVVRFVQIEEENHKHRFGKTYGSHKISCKSVLLIIDL